MPADKFIVVGDRVLLKPRKADTKTRSGLYLPPGVQQSEGIGSGFVVGVGPGYPIPAVAEADEPWKSNGERVRYIPLQARIGDLAIFLLSSAQDLEFDGEQFIIVNQAAILLLVRDEGLFE